MDFSLGDKVWVKRNCGQWWPAVIAELASPSNSKSKKKKASYSGVTVKFPFEETSEVVPDRRRIKSFDCPECEQLSTEQGSERSSRRRSSLDRDLFQRAVAAVTGQRTETTTDDTMVDQENVNPARLSPLKTIISDTPRNSDSGTKRALFCSDLPDITPSKRIRYDSKLVTSERARRKDFSVTPSRLCRSETSVETTNDSLVPETDTSLDDAASENVLPTGLTSPSVRMSTRSAKKLRFAFNTSVQTTPTKTKEEVLENENDQTVDDNDRHLGSSEEQSRDCTGPGPGPVTSECSPPPNASPSGDCVEDSDDDDELPVFNSQSPSKYQGANFQPGDIVWAKCLSYPPWPALVRNVYKKRGKLDKVSVFFIGDEFKREQMGFRFKYHPKKIQHFCTEEGHTLERRDNAAVMAVVTMVDDYLTKKALGKTHRNPFDYFKIAEEEPLSGVDDDVTFDEASSVRLDDVTENLTSDEDSVVEEETDEGLKMPDDVVEELRLDATRTQELVNFIRSDECQAYARAVLRGTQASQLHNEFRPDDECTLGSFGPIQDDDQSFEVYRMLMNICDEENYLTISQRHAYVYKVLAPETIVFAIRRCNHRSESRAWSEFRKGPKYSRALLQYQHDSIIASAERIPEKERIRHRQLQAGRFQRLMEKFERS